MLPVAIFVTSTSPEEIAMSESRSGSRFPFAPEMLTESGDPVLDEIVRRVTRELDVPISLVTLVLDDVQFFKTHTGLPGDLPPACGVSFRQFVVRDGVPFVVDECPGGCAGAPVPGAGIRGPRLPWRSPAGRGGRGGGPLHHRQPTAILRTGVARRAGALRRRGGEPVFRTHRRRPRREDVVSGGGMRRRIPRGSRAGMRNPARIPRRPGSRCPRQA